MDWKNVLKGLQTDEPIEETTLENEAAEDKRPLQKSPLHIAVERKGRGGKTATIIYGFECDDAEIKAVEKKLKQRTGVGGSSRGGEILLQGDCREKAATWLREMGYKIK